MQAIILPPKCSGQANESWPEVRSVVITGANGSGKTRIGVWMDENNPDRKVHRIAAQRALHLPDLVDPVPYERATSQLHYGHYDPSWNESQYRQNKRGTRWGGEPSVRMLSDYPFVVATLFAEEARRNRQYTATALSTIPTVLAPDCNLDVLKKIWSKLFPHRELVIGPDRISARVPNKTQEYAGQMMSDGERVALYLLGQVLCAPPEAIVVIDEPEIHLHRAIQSSLWDEAEASRSDCTFVYITHDLEFAASRSSARKIWAKEYDGVNWEWQEVEASTELPDDLILEVLGSRRPVLFVEGDANSFDSTLYRALYPEKLIIPMASCQRVIGARRGMQQLSSWHNLNIEGLVDRDYRSDEEIASLRAQSLIVADVAEIENLFCVPAALLAAAQQLMIDHPEEVVQAAKVRVLSELQKAKDAQVAARALAEIQFRLGGFGPKAGKANASTIEADLANHVANIDVAAVFKQSTDLYTSILENADYDSALRFYNCKGITSFVAGVFELKASRYCNIVTGIVRSPEGAAVVAEMRARTT